MTALKDSAPSEKTSDGTVLDRLVALTGDDLDNVNQAILDKMQSPVALIPQLASYIISAGGKRVRPLLTLSAARLCGYEGDRHIGLASCVEFIHTATLLHDDVVDESDLRRGRASANALWGNKASVLVGDFLFSRAFQLLVADGSIKVCGILADASATLAEGEVMQLMTANDIATEETTYLKVIEAKTASLFSAACRLGAVVADRPQEEEDALASYGLNLGLAFQIVDDALDYSAKEAELGKAIGDDFRDGKITLPVLLAIQKADAEEQAFWKRTLEDQDLQDGDLEHALALMAKYDTLATTMARAEAYGDAARQALTLFPDSPLRGVFEDLIGFCLKRGY